MNQSNISGLPPTSSHVTTSASTSAPRQQANNQSTESSAPGSASNGLSRGQFTKMATRFKASTVGTMGRNMINRLTMKRASKAVAELTKPQKKDASTQTTPILTVSYKTLRAPGVTTLASFPTKPMYDWDAIYDRQDDELNTRIIESAKVEIPPELANSATLRGQIGHPMDMRLCINPETGGLLVSKLEDNTTGWGALLTTPPTALTHLFTSVREVAAKAAEDSTAPLILVLCSGHGTPNAEGKMEDNPLMAEKWVIGDQFRQELSDIFGTDERGKDKVQVMGLVPKDFDALAKKTNLAHNNKPTVMYGYSLETVREDGKGNNLVEVHNNKLYMNCLDENGVRSLRPVAYVFNDRGLSYIEEKFGDVDPKKTMIGSMSKLGVNKALSYDMHNNFLKTLTPEQREEWGVCARDINFTEVSANPAESKSLVDSIMHQVQENLDNGTKVIIKPKGTGSGHGIAVFNVGDSKAKIEEGVRDSIAFVDFHYNKEELEKVAGKSFKTFEEYQASGYVNTDGLQKKAGATYTVAEFLKGPEIDVPEHLKAQYGHLQGCQAELRIGVQRYYGEDGKQYLTAGLSVAKLQQPGSDIANVGGQTLGTNIDPDDLTVAASQKEVLELLGINEKIATQISSFCSNYSLYAQQQIHEANKAKFNWTDD